MKKIATTTAAAVLALGSLSITAPANAAPVHMPTLNVQTPTDGWGLRDRICGWFPYWC